MKKNFHQLISLRLLIFLTTLAFGALPFHVNGFNISLSFAHSPGKGSPNPLKLDPPYQIKTVVIDAGHGGHDPGCSGSESHEKHIALAIALQLGRQIEANFPTIRVILTRSDDTFIPLYERAAIANRHQADLFISIHCNSMPGSSTTTGSETYVMGLHTAEHNLNVAKRENSAILLEANYEKNYDYDPNSSEGHILLSMFQNAYLEQSIRFAEKVEHHFHHTAARRSRGVKQAGFVVLKETTMPSVLVETGFLSSRSEESYLLSPEGQQQIAHAILTAFAEYKRELEGGPAVALKTSQPPPTNSKPAVTADAAPPKGGSTTVVHAASFKWNNDRATTPPANVTKKSGAVATTTTDGDGEESPIPVSQLREETQQQPQRSSWSEPVRQQPQTTPTRETAQPQAQPAAYVADERPEQPASYNVGSTPGVIIPRPYEQPQKNWQVRGMTAEEAAASAPVTSAPREYAANGNRVDTYSSSTAAAAGISYAVQLVAATRPVNTDAPLWQNLGYQVEMLQEDNYYKYQARNFPSFQQAFSARLQLQQRGFRDAFIVAYQHGKRISVEEAQQILGEE